MNICRIVTCASNHNCPTLMVVKIHGYLLSYCLKIAAKGLSTSIPNLQKIPVESDESVMAWFPNSWTARQGINITISGCVCPQRARESIMSLSILILVQPSSLTSILYSAVVATIQLIPYQQCTGCVLVNFLFVCFCRPVCWTSLHHFYILACFSQLLKIFLIRDVILNR